MHAPPVVNKHVEHAQNHHEEDGGPLGFEADGYHPAGTETEKGDDHSCDAPCALDAEPEEQEDEEDTASEQEIFFAISFTDRREASKELPSRDHRFTENHDESTDDAQITEEEIEVEDEAITEALDDDYTEETTYSILGVALRYNGTGSDKHGEDVQKQEKVRYAPWEMSVFLQIPDLVIPLGRDSQRILQEGHDDQETTNGRQMGFQRLGVDLDIVFNVLAESPQLFDRVVRVGGSVAC